MMVGTMACGDDGTLAANRGRLEVTPERIDFGSVLVGARKVGEVTVSNAGSGRLSVTATQEGAEAFGWSVDAVELKPGEARPLQVDFRPTTAGTFDGRLTFRSDEGTKIVTLAGAAHPVAADWRPGPAPAGAPTCTEDGDGAAFGSVPVGAELVRTVRFENRGEVPFAVAEASILGNDAFALVQPVPASELLPTEALEVAIRFLPKVAGAASARLQFRLVSGPPQELLLCGVGVGAVVEERTPKLCVEPDVLNFGRAEAPVEQRLQVVSCGDAPLTVTAVEWAETNATMRLLSPLGAPRQLQPGERMALLVRFAPEAEREERAQLRIYSDDPDTPERDVLVAGGGVVPREAGRFLYFWRIDNTNNGGDILRAPLQGQSIIRQVYGSSSDQVCSGCHQASPDGRFVGFVEHRGGNRFQFQVIEAESQRRVAVDFLPETMFFSWNPDPNTEPPYQYAYDQGGDIHIASLRDGYIGKLAGADDPSVIETMPSWGPDKIAFVRGRTASAQVTGLVGPTDIYLASPQGGEVTPVPGASQHGQASYYPAISPNGRWLAYTHSASARRTAGAPDARIRVVDLDRRGSVDDLPALNQGASSFPTWSLDGRYLSFSSDRGQVQDFDWDIFVAGFDPLTGQAHAAEPLLGANTSQFEHAAVWSR